MTKKYELTPEHQARLPEWRDRWIANAMSTAAMTDEDRAKCREAVIGMYAAAKLPPPRVVFVASPFIAAFSSGFAAGLQEIRAATSAATGGATMDAAAAATIAATVDATRDAIEVATEASTRAATRAATVAATSAATRAATSAAVDDATSAATRDAIATSAMRATRDAIVAKTWAATRNATEAATMAATWDAAWGATSAAVDDATSAATWVATSAATRDAIVDKTWAATRTATEAATWAATEAVTEAATWGATSAATEAATWTATAAATRNATEAATMAATWGATSAATSASARNTTMSATWDATRAATRTVTAAATSTATSAATEAATWTATAAAIRDVTWAATAAATWYAIDLASFISVANFLGGTDGGHRLLKCAEREWDMRQYGNQWSGLDAYLSFFQDVAGLDLPEYANYAHWRTLCERSGPRYVHKTFCIISDRPEILTVDDRNRPHNDTGPFCRWRDGSALYAVHGVRVPAWVIEHPDAITTEKIIAEPNSEIQRVMIERMGWDRYIAAVSAEVIDHDEARGTLIRTTNGELVVRVINRSPEPDGSFRNYILPVADNCEPLPDPSNPNGQLGAPQELTALNAVASTFGMTGKEYERIVGIET